MKSLHYSRHNEECPNFSLRFVDKKFKGTVELGKITQLKGFQAELRKNAGHPVHFKHNISNAECFRIACPKYCAQHFLGSPAHLVSDGI